MGMNPNLGRCMVVCWRSGVDNSLLDLRCRLDKEHEGAHETEAFEAGYELEYIAKLVWSESE